jgi:ferredoxin-type protein NapG
VNSHKGKTMSDSANKQSRREFMLKAAGSLGGVAVISLGLGLYARQTSALPTYAIRPPGALPETEFLSACIRCGLCVRDCPFDTLKLARFAEQVVTGTPYFVPRHIPCEMCDDIPCVKACPTGALDHQLEDINDARMGLAVVIDQESCIAFHGLRCEVCYNVCPLREKAITLELQHNPRTAKHAMFIPRVHSSACTGCGKCEQACILQQAAIKVLPVQLAKADAGEHYRMGWQEKQKSGGSLVTPDASHQFNLPQGVEYDYQSGQVRDENKTATEDKP